MTSPDRTSVCKEVRQLPYWGEFLPHIPYSPDLAFSTIHPFGPLKDALWGRRFADDDVLEEHGEREELRRFSKEFYVTGQQRVTQGGKRLLITNKTLWKNNLNLVNYVAIIFYYTPVMSVRRIQMPRSHFRVTRAATRCQETQIYRIQSYGCAYDI